MRAALGLGHSLMHWSGKGTDVNEEWYNKVVADNHISPRAKQLAGIIARRFGTMSTNYVLFYDTDCTAFIDLSSTDVRKTRLELERCGYLVELHCNGGRKPSYKLRAGEAA